VVIVFCDAVIAKIRNRKATIISFNLIGNLLKNDPDNIYIFCHRNGFFSNPIDGIQIKIKGDSSESPFQKYNTPFSFGEGFGMRLLHQ
jgi:hypothetical protein